VNERISRRRLPHWDVPGAAYFVTTCLEGSIPALGLLEIDRVRASLETRTAPQGMTDAEWKIRRWKQVFVVREHWLDHRPAARQLEDPLLANEIESALYHFDGVRYDLLAWVVMPSHIHWVFRPLNSWVESLGSEAEARSPRERIQHSINRHAAKRCNRLLGKQGSFWQRESYDHWVRDDDELQRIVDYIHANPVVAGLVAQPELYRFSSAYQAG
jgi:putative transposase